LAVHFIASFIKQEIAGLLLNFYSKCTLRCNRETVFVDIWYDYFFLGEWPNIQAADLEGMGWSSLGPFFTG